MQEDATIIMGLHNNTHLKIKYTNEHTIHKHKQKTQA